MTGAAMMIPVSRTLRLDGATVLTCFGTWDTQTLRDPLVVASGDQVRIDIDTVGRMYANGRPMQRHLAGPRGRLP